jgi:copper(I)-binding protein
VKWILVSVLTTLLFSSCSAPGVEGLVVRDAWARPALQGGNGAVYFVIRSSAADELVGVTSDVAESVEMHESRMNGEVMEMRQLQSVPLGAGEQVMFEPGGFHIMLIGLRQDLQIGDEFAISLRFKDHEDLQINVTVTDSPGAETEH